ncbi:GNAT family N-acetyltransferase [Candidatus Protochlamydia sp. R18]|uniref:GNAT family N-acetyltransferase n=1 Tax=Candidatus Protochlamydia sp. R18 TaxID=1353977 RepID=UPI0005A9223A|nr:GNAT family N-acetyltransferase [Candidatus Protochlamydia sp. R18]
MRRVRTERLILRFWQEDDLEPFAQLNADPRVKEYFPGILSRQESDWKMSIFQLLLIIHSVIEIGWRLAFNHWGRIIQQKRLNVP